MERLRDGSCHFQRSRLLFMIAITFGMIVLGVRSGGGGGGGGGRARGEVGGPEAAQSPSELGRHRGTLAASRPSGSSRLQNRPPQQ